MKKKLLFITEKYCDGDPDKGLTNSVHNLFGSFQHSFTAEEWDFKTIHYDEIALKGKHIDDFAQKIYDSVKPDAVLCTLLGTMSCNPSEKFFKLFKDAGCKVIFLWPDLGTGWTLDSYQKYNDFVDLHIGIASENNIQLPKLKYMWTPEDPAYFYPPMLDEDGTGETKDIDILFLGTAHNQERMECLHFLKDRLNGYSVYFGGGQRHEKLSHEKYAELTRRSKIVINFPFSPSGLDQVKGRVFESIACKSLLMERKNNKTSQFFDPLTEYVEYTSKEDLLKKIIFYQENNDIRERMAERALKTYITKWSHNQFWYQVFEELYK